jgi:hypothetical protein
MKLLNFLRRNDDEEHTFLLMLVTLSSLIIITPFFDEFTKIGYIMDIFFTAVLIFGVFSVTYRKYAVTIALCLVIPVLIISWSSKVVDMPGALLFSDFLAVLFFLFLILAILSHIFRQDEVTREVIYGSIVVYMLIGVMWAFIYKIMVTMHPGSFNIPDFADSDTRSAMLYYSFTTLTTLGYGDMTPLTGPTKSLAIMEAITGQMFIAVLIARLVGTYISQSLLKKQSKQKD